MKNKKIKLMVGTLLITMIGATLTGCGGNSEGSGENGSSGEVTISISGSTSVGPLMEKIQPIYEEKNSNVALEIQMTGSGAGIKDVENGTSEIGMSSRALKDDEAAKLQGTLICYDGIAALVNPNNKVKDITVEQLKDIYTGKITNWKELGGNDAPIVVVSREDGSGTRDGFQQAIGYKSEELTQDATIVDGSGAVQTTVAGNENAIGYASFEYINDTVSALVVENVEATAENVKNGTYKVQRPFVLVTKEDTLTEAGKALIDFVLSEEGQQIVADNKLVPLD